MCLATFAWMVVGVGVRDDAAMRTWRVRERVSDLLPGNSETCEAADRWLVKLFWFGGDVGVGWGGWGGRLGEGCDGGGWGGGGEEGQQQPSNAR